MDYTLFRDAPSTKKGYTTYTHRQELEQLQKTMSSLPENAVTAKMHDDVSKLTPIQVPGHISYIYSHFLECWGMFGPEMTLHDIVLYHRMFAPAMSRIEMLLISRAHRHAIAFIDKMKEDGQAEG